jgi:hypothetical protein
MSTSELLSVAAITMPETVDRKATHGWGSTPSQRHFVSHEQALKILEAGVKRAKEIKYVENHESVPELVFVDATCGAVAASVH